METKGEAMPSAGNRRLSVVLIASIACLWGCTEGRSTAAAELLRFERAVQDHVRQFGAYPETILPDQPADTTNLPYMADGEVALHILPRPDGYEAISRYENWTCSMSVSGSSRTAPECFPR